MGVTMIAPVDVTPAASGAWTDVDCSSHIPSGHTGVILHLVSTDAADKVFGLRKNGSSDNRITGDIQATDHQWAVIGVDGSRIFEAYLETHTTFKIWLIGSFDSEATFLTNAVDVSPAGTGVTDVDITGTTGGGAVGAFVEIYGPGAGGSNWMIRKNGSTDNRSQDNAGSNHVFAMIGLDADEIFEVQFASTTIDMFLVGYVSAGATFNTNANDLSTGTTGSYVDMTAFAAGVAAVYESFSASSTNTAAYRQNGSSEDIYPAAQAMKHAFAIVEGDGSRVVEQKVSGTGQDTFEIGYFNAVAVVAVYLIPAQTLTGVSRQTAQAIGYH